MTNERCNGIANRNTLGKSIPREDVAYLLHEIERLQAEILKRDNLLGKAEDLLNPGREHRMGSDPNCHICVWMDDVGALTIIPSPVEPSAQLTQCPYCQRPADSEGGIFHAAGCKGLETVALNRLQYDALARHHGSWCVCEACLTARGLAEKSGANYAPK